MDVEERIDRISTIFSYFHNPDKETVLTPWRVVNMHMSDCLGGWCFYNKEFDDINTVKEIENGTEIQYHRPRFVDRGKVTCDIFDNYDARILEINSKTGLYPLYMAYSLYQQKVKAEYAKHELDDNEDYNQVIWDQIISDNIFVICKTPMAVSITKRTLVGFRNVKRVNAKCYTAALPIKDLMDAGLLKQEDYKKMFAEGIKAKDCDLIDVIRVKPDIFKRDVMSGYNYWELQQDKFKNLEMIHFNAVVGNPPYQLMGASGGSNDAPIYQHFFEAAKQVTQSYISMIIPSRWFAAGRENLIGDFRSYMLKEGHVYRLSAFMDSRFMFPTVEIKGGVCYFLVDIKYNGKCDYTLFDSKGEKESHFLQLDAFDILIRNPKLTPLVQKVQEKAKQMELSSMDKMISSDTPFGIPSNPRTSTKNPYDVESQKSQEFNLPLYIKNKKREIEYVRRSDIHKNEQDIDFVKVFVPESAGSGFDKMVVGKPWLANTPSVCTQTFLYLKFNSKKEAENFITYYKTKFFRVLVAAYKITQSAPNKVYQFVPKVDFNQAWDDDKLYKLFGIEDQKEYIESLIDPWNDQIED